MLYLVTFDKLMHVYYILTWISHKDEHLKKSTSYFVSVRRLTNCIFSLFCVIIKSISAPCSSGQYALNARRRNSLIIPDMSLEEVLGHHGANRREARKLGLLLSSKSSEAERE